MMEQPSLLTDLSEFVMLHRPHGELHANASEPTPNGYRLEVARAIASFERALQLRPGLADAMERLTALRQRAAQKRT
jgi:hypothetical protein